MTDNSEHTVRKVLLKRPVLLFLITIIVIGVFLAWFDIWHTDSRQREDLLYRARLVARAIRIERIEALSGTAADKTLPAYHRLKEQLAAIRAVTPGCRFVYLLGQRPDGSVFFFVDNEPTGSENESPPGQTYDEISDTDLQAFNRRMALTSGPTKDRWGTWISAMVPLIDPENDHVAVVLGMDFPAIGWEGKLLRSALPSALLTLGMLLSLACGSFLLRGLDRPSNHPRHKYHYREIILAIVILGIFLSISMARVVNNKIRLDRKRAFQQLAQTRAEDITDRLHTLQYRELEGLAQLFEASEWVSPAEFSRYSLCLLKNTAIQYWAWAERTRPAEGVYFPIVHVAPLSSNKGMPGYDLGADRHRRVTLEKAIESGLTTCHISIAAHQGVENPTTIEVFHPAFRHNKKKRPMGVGMAVFIPRDLVHGARPNESVQLALSLVSAKTGAIRTLATSWKNDICPGTSLSFEYPVFAFGRTFLISARAGMAYINLFPPQVPLVTLLIGLTLTALLAVLTNLACRKREHLEELVDNRSRDLIATQYRMDLAVTKIKRAQEALERSETRLRTLVNALPDLVWLKDPKGKYLFCNKRFERFFGAPEADIIGKTDYDFLTSEAADFFRKKDQLAITAGKPCLNEETVVFADDGHREFLETIKTHIYDPEGELTGVLGIARDITERKRTQEEKEKLQELLLQSQKLEAIGQLAGGVAHDLNNLLSPILGYGDLLLEDLENKDEQYAAVEAILQAGHRARDLVGQLLAFSRRQRLVFKPIDVNRTITKFQRLLRRTIPEDILLQISLTRQIQPVMADVGQIEQVIMNLAVNAAGAMPTGGRLTIETAMTELDEVYAESHPSVIPGPHLMLAVSDTGHGMDEETTSQIFEPFFSTKGEQGTGLGLATVFGIVKQHKGSIWVYSEPGQGATFKIYLPVCDAAAVEKKNDSQADRELTGNETILLVEDDQKVRDLTRIILTRRGYTVLPAANGREALALAATHGNQVHLLLTDVVMPVMDGKELYVKAAARHPDLKVVFMSGYTNTEIVHRGVINDDTAFIQKPFTIKAIATKVREVLDSTSGDKVS